MNSRIPASGATSDRDPNHLRFTCLPLAEQRATAARRCRDLTDRGWALAREGREGEALALYQQARAQNPSFWCRCLGDHYVENGNYKRGWQLVADERYGSAHWPDGTPRLGGLPRWDGSPIGGALAVLPGGGFGDQILFARFLKCIKPRVGQLVVVAPPPMQRLMGGVPGVDEVLLPGQGRSPAAWIDASALPYFAGVSDSAAVRREPYLGCDPPDVERLRLPHRDGLRVGLAWKAGMGSPKRWLRSIPALRALKPLWAVPGVDFISLQRGDGETEARTSALPLNTSLIDTARDLADTAAIISQLDLVIATDVCVANLAGAMGRPVWVLSIAPPEFRWAHGWYSSARVFRQSVLGYWCRPIADVAAALAELAGRRREVA